MKANAIRLGVAALATVAVLGTAAPAFAQRHHHGGNNAAGAAAIGLLGGLALGAAISNPAPPPVYYAPAPAYVTPAPVYTRSPHVDWCTANTPGYNAYDNTYQGYYAGERIICRSPYGG